MLRWRLHGRRIDGLHRNRAIAEAIEVLHGRLVMGVVGTSLGPGRSVVLIGVLVVVVHLLQLADGGGRETSGRASSTSSTTTKARAETTMTRAAVLLPQVQERPC